MFNTPIKHTRLKNLQEVFDFSYVTSFKDRPKKKYKTDGYIIFTDQIGNVFFTPVRPEIDDILKENGYQNSRTPISFSPENANPFSLLWIEKIAKEENWAYTYECAFNFACSKGIKPVTINNDDFEIVEIIFNNKYDDINTHTCYYGLTKKFLKDSKHNIGTYIFVDEKTIVICDEYGRTFLLKSKTIINDLVNTLIDAGYTRTIHPERYLYKYEPISEE